VDGAHDGIERRPRKRSREQQRLDAKAHAERHEQRTQAEAPGHDRGDQRQRLGDRKSLPQKKGEHEGAAAGGRRGLQSRMHIGAVDEIVA